MPEADERSVRERRFGSDMSLRHRAARGTIINGAFLTMVNVLAMARGLIMAGFLSTTEYGLWAVLLVMIGTLALVRQVGIGERFVQQDEDDQEAEFQRAFTLELMLATAFAGLGVLLVLAMAALYDRSEIILPGLIMLASLPLSALGLPLAIFYRRMDFRRQRTLQAADPLVAFVVTIGLGIAGAGYWSLVIGSVAGPAVGAAIAVAASPYRLRLRFTRAATRSYASFSWPIFVAGVASVVIGQGLVGVGEAVLGLAGVGVIAVCTQIAQFADRADRAVTDTLYPALCAVKDRVDLLQESFVTSNRLALMWGVPFGLGVAIFSEDLLRLLGERWLPGTELLRFTAITLAIHQLGFNWQAFYRARGDTKPIGVAGIVGILTFGAIIAPLLATEGLRGLGIGILAAELMHLCLRAFYLRKLFPTLRFARHAARAILPTLPAAALVLAVRQFDSAGDDLLIAAAEALLFVATTAIFTLIFERPLMRELVSYLRRARAADAPA